jgi:hypothetical protein
MKRALRIWRALLPVLAAAVAVLALAACGGNGAAPKSDHPTSQQPKADQPKPEHPKAEHPKGEHPKGEHPKAEPTK